MKRNQLADVIICSITTQGWMTALHLQMYNWHGFFFFLYLKNVRTIIGISFKVKVTQLRYIRWYPITTDITGYDHRLICQSSLLSTHSLRHIRLSGCKALLISRIISHAHSRYSSLSLSCALSHSLFHWRGILGHALWDLWMQRWRVSFRWPSSQGSARLNPQRRLISAWSWACQGLLHLIAGQSIPLHYLLDVFLFFTLQNAQEVL